MRQTTFLTGLFELKLYLLSCHNFLVKNNSNMKQKICLDSFKKRFKGHKISLPIHRSIF